MQRPLLLVLLLCISVAAVARQAPDPQKKQITDTAEYNAYVAAINEQAPARKIQLLDEFLAKYPSTVVKEDVLNLKLVAQQQAGQPFEQTARQILEINPNNYQSLLVLSFLFVQAPPSEQDPQYQQKLSDAETLAKRGLEQLAALPRPANISDADYQKSKKVSESTFHQALGLIALNRKDLPAAQTSFRKAAELAPEDAATFYRLANAYVAEKPVKYTEMLWAFARAVVIEGPSALAPAGKTQVDAYLTKAYSRYHGSEEGLDKLKEGAKASPFPTGGFRVIPEAELKPAAPPPPATPTPTNPESMSFGQMKDVLAAGGDKAKELWGKLKGQTLGLEGKVISATPPARPKTVRLAVLPSTAETAGFYDVVLTLTAASLRPIAAGKMAQFEGVVNSYKEVPFSLQMIGGKIVPPAKPATPKTAPRRPTARKKG